MGIEFFQTAMGQKFYGVDVPSITKSLETIAKHMGVIARRIEQEEEERKRYHMEKYGVAEEQQDEKKEKQAAAGCPKCGSPVARHGNTLVCPNCGTEPFEQEKKA